MLREHSREVTDLCFDEQAEYLASASSDGTVAVRCCCRLLPVSLCCVAACDSMQQHCPQYACMMS